MQNSTFHTLWSFSERFGITGYYNPSMSASAISIWCPRHLSILSFPLFVTLCRCNHSHQCAQSDVMLVAEAVLSGHAILLECCTKMKHSDPESDVTNSSNCTCMTCTTCMQVKVIHFTSLEIAVKNNSSSYHYYHNIYCCNGSTAY